MRIIELLFSRYGIGITLLTIGSIYADQGRAGWGRLYSFWASVLFAELRFNTTIQGQIMKSNVIQLNLPGNKRQYDWLLAKIKQADRASRIYADHMKADPDGPYEYCDITREYGYSEALQLVEFWIKDLYRSEI